MPYIRPDRRIVILTAVDELKQMYGRWPTTQEIAAQTRIPARSVLDYLQRLEREGKIERLYIGHVVRRLPKPSGDAPPK